MEEEYFYLNEDDPQQREKIANPSANNANPIYPVEQNHYSSNPAEWATLARPANWHGSWPPQTADDITTVFGTIPQPKRWKGDWPPQTTDETTKGLANEILDETCDGPACNSTSNCDYTTEDGEDGFYLAQEDWRSLFELRRRPNVGVCVYFKGYVDPDTKATGNTDFDAISEGDTFTFLAGELRPQAKYFPGAVETWNTGTHGGYVGTFDLRSNDKNRRLECYIDAFERSNYARFINHSCGPNAKFVAARWGTLRYTGIQAISQIEPGDEITLDYGESYTKDFFKGENYCYCGAKDCCYPPKKKQKNKKDEEIKSNIRREIRAHFDQRLRYAQQKRAVEKRKKTTTPRKKSTASKEVIEKRKSPPKPESDDDYKETPKRSKRLRKD